MVVSPHPAVRSDLLLPGVRLSPGLRPRAFLLVHRWGTRMAHARRRVGLRTLIGVVAHDYQCASARGATDTRITVHAAPSIGSVGDSYRRGAHAVMVRASQSAGYPTYVGGARGSSINLWRRA